MKWISVDKILPLDGQAVVICRGPDNWLRDHLIYGSRLLKILEKSEVWRWDCAMFKRGKLLADNPNGPWGAEDQFGNNLLPYCWQPFGSHSSYFGQDVTHWAPLSMPEGVSSKFERRFKMSEAEATLCELSVLRGMLGDMFKDEISEMWQKKYNEVQAALAKERGQT